MEDLDEIPEYAEMINTFIHTRLSKFNAIRNSGPNSVSPSVPLLAVGPVIYRDIWVYRHGRSRPGDEHTKRCLLGLTESFWVDRSKDMFAREIHLLHRVFPDTYMINTRRPMWSRQFDVEFRNDSDIRDVLQTLRHETPHLRVFESMWLQ